MRILSIDPGYDRCGVAIIESGHQPTVLFSACITTAKTASHETRLAAIYRSLEEITDTWNPEGIALETLFFSVNKTTALKVAEARGVAALLAGMRAIPLIELSPQEVKLSMTGIGNAAKEQVRKMASLTLKIDLSKKLDDEVDAIALGVAATQKWRVDGLRKSLAT